MCDIVTYDHGVMTILSRLTSYTSKHFNDPSQQVTRRLAIWHLLLPLSDSRCWTYYMQSRAINQSYAATCDFSLKIISLHGILTILWFRFRSLTLLANDPLIWSTTDPYQVSWHLLAVTILCFAGRKHVVSGKCYPLLL